MKKIFIMVVIALFLVTTQIKAGEILPSSSNVVPTSVYPIPDEFSNSSPWSKIFNEMLDDESEVFILQVQGYGGSAMTANGFFINLQNIESTGKKVVAKIVGPAYSAHAYLSCFADKVEFTDAGSLMFHSVYVKDSFLFGLIEYNNFDVDPSQKILVKNMINQCKKVGLINAKDIAVINNGQDVTLYMKDGKLQKIYSDDEFGKEYLNKEIRKLLLGFVLILGLIFFIKKV